MWTTVNKLYLVWYFVEIEFLTSYFKLGFAKFLNFDIQFQICMIFSNILDLAAFHQKSLKEYSYIVIVIHFQYSSIPLNFGIKKLVNLVSTSLVWQFLDYTCSKLRFFVIGWFEHQKNLCQPAHPCINSNKLDIKHPNVWLWYSGKMFCSNFRALFYIQELAGKWL